MGLDRRQNYYRMAPDDAVVELNSHKLGLTNPEAERRVAEYGANVLYRGHREPPLITFARQFKSLFVVILLISAGFSLYLRDSETAAILVAIALINAAVGFFQEYKAEKLMQQLEHLMVPRAKVVRNDSVCEIDSSRLALGDIVSIEQGDAVPADLRILEEDELATNDFALTGESNPSRKFVHAIEADVPLAARQNLVFMGTTVATGTARGIVIATGMRTELGRIASLSQVVKADDSPLQREINNLATRIAQGTVLLAAVLAIVALQANLGLKAALLFAISVSAAMIPNGLVAEVNITLASAAARMARARALIKRLSAVETLGAANIILTDKTGTLTKNEMTVTQFLIGRTLYRTTGTGYAPGGTIVGSRGRPVSTKALANVRLFFLACSLACNAKLNPPDNQHGSWYVLGDPTEGAIVALARKGGIAAGSLDAAYEEVKEFQFDSGRKLMSSVRRYDGGLALFIKGAPEVILERCRKLWDHGHLRNLTAADRTFFVGYNDAQAQAAMRNLAVAYRILPKNTDLANLDMEQLEHGLTFLGIVSMEDPLRADVPTAMAAARAAHVRVSVVTGDYPATAKAIAAAAQLSAGQAVAVVTADELRGLSDTQVQELIDQGGTVFSRVSPEDKLRIVELAKAGGHVVAVTGDGINDAPALKRADIGVAMGKTGTDIAKDAADIVLLDDSFATLVDAIHEGRLTFANIRKAARCALTDNVGELGIILISLAGQALWHIPLAITAVQILAIDIVAEVWPITALGWDKPASDLMHERPRRLNDHILNRATVREFILFGLLAAGISYAVFLSFFARRGISPSYIDTTSLLYAKATILTYLTLVLCQFANLLLVRADAQARFFTDYLWSNKRLLIAFAISFFCIANILYNPLVRPYLGAGPLDVIDWLTALAGAGAYFGIRLLQRRTRHHSREAVIALHQQVHGKASAARI